jgi:endonuclease/exonuclease/phosphatase family metal-dependent hydrolase
MRRLLTLTLAGLLAACGTDRIAGPPSPDVELGLQNVAPAGPLTVLSRNMYIGAPVEPILAETDPNLVPVRVAEAWAVLQATDFPARARAMADEIARTRPHLVGLQEVELIRSQFPSDIVVAPPAVPNPVPNATVVEFDFLATLLAELAARGLEYQVAATVQDIDVEVPRFDGVQGGIPLFTDIRLTDRDVILARAGVPVANAAAGNYAAKLPAPAGIEVPRGWTAVDATVGGVTYRFVNTHFESDAEIIRFFQAQELMGILAAETRPVVLVGDLNSGPGRPEDQGGQATYDFILSTGFEDSWAAHPRAGDGFTCCNAGDLSNLTPGFEQRIDLVLVRGAGFLPLQVTLVGDQVLERRRFGVWPSDHAGVAASLILAP